MTEMTAEATHRKAAPPPLQSALRVGVLVDGPRLAGWQATAISKLTADSKLDVAVVAAATDPATPRAGSLLARLANQVDLAIARKQYGRPWASVPIDPDASVDVHSIANVNPRSDGTLWHLILDLRASTGSRNPLPGSLSGLRLPIVRLHHPATGPVQSECLGAGEVLDDVSFTEISAVLLPPDGGDARRLAHGVYTTFRYSWNANRRQLLHKSTVIIHDAMCRAADARVAAGHREWWTEFPTATQAIPATRNRASASIGGLATTCYRIACRAWRKRTTRDRWQLTSCIGAVPPTQLDDLKVHAPPPTAFWADPFVIARDGELWVFFEQFRYADTRATICAGRLVDRELRDTRVVLAPPYHVSYPFLLEHGGQLYMVPETHESRAIELWQCTRFPDQWVKVRALIDNISAADATIFEQDGRWWMFANVDRSGLLDHGDELHLYHTDDPVAGTWEPHPANPVLIDAPTARMAGAVIRRPDGRLLRPSQLGGDIYGLGIRFMEITELSETTYSERVADDPINWLTRVPRVHHFHSSDGVVVTDICR